MADRARSLRSELLVSLGFVTSSAVILVGLTTVLILGGDPREALWPLVALWLGSTAVFLCFGVYLVHRAVIRPLQMLAAEADSLAAGVLSPAPPPYETRELRQLAERYRAMAEQLIEANTQTVRAEKLAGIGRLAAGVAHEIRNPLGALGTYVDVLRRRGSDPAVTDEMHGAIGRIDRIVQGLLDYARPGKNGSNGHAPAPAVNLEDAVRTAVAFVAQQPLAARHQVAVELAPELPMVRGDRHAIEQIVINLLVNACQASSRGRVAIGAVPRRFEPRRPEARRSDAGTAAESERRAWVPRPRRMDLAQGTPGALLYVADDGPGVPEADRERIFDPFFTTKDPGEGTGLGLAIVARTVHEAGGVVWVDRAREGGAVFKIFLPHAGATDACAHR
jgi:signal transduction histidine kinase